jgi:aminoglycoside phosphotransferase (APT) family kinase protein
LKRAIAHSVNKHEHDIVQFTKFAEGRFNRIFKATLVDGSNILARLPYPCTIPKYFATASEAATIDFLRIHGIPVPKVYGYSARSDNEVGSEYIIMEMASGRPVEDDWITLTTEERLKLLVEYTKLEAKLFSIDIPAYGSIYYQKDLQPDTERIPITDVGTQFCVGPAVAWDVWDFRRLRPCSGQKPGEFRIADDQLCLIDA